MGLMRLLAFGDSITARRGDLPVASSLLSERLDKSGVGNRLVNAGVPGDTTEMGRERFERDVLAHSPDVVVLCFGTNDAALDVWKGVSEPRVPLERYVENLRHFAVELRRRGAAVVFFSSPPMHLTENLKPLYGKEPYLSEGFNFMLDQYVARARRVAKECSCPFAEVNRAFWDKVGGDAGRLPEYLPDGMHPNAAGQELIADCVWEHLPTIQKETAK